MQEHHLIALILVISILCIVPVLAVIEAIENFFKDAKHNRQRVRTLSQQNYELRDEISRLTRER